MTKKHPQKLDKAWRDAFLDGTPIERDQMGFGFHPAMPDLGAVDYRNAFAQAGVEIFPVEAEYQLSDADLDLILDHGYSDGMGGAGFDVNAWKPKPPAGDGWQLVGVNDTDYGLCAWFAREIGQKQ